MPLQATSGAASQDAYGGNGVAVVPAYIEDVFSAYLFLGTQTTTTINTGIDLSGKGGLVWLKDRTGGGYHSLGDTARSGKRLCSNTTDAETSSYPFAFTSTGFTADGNLFDSGRNFVTWTFRKQPKFFDIVTYTGDGVAGRTVAHNLGSVPGCIIVKETGSANDWIVYHRSLGDGSYIILNSAGTSGVSSTRWNDTTPTSTVFTVGTNNGVNGNGSTYVAYLFAHDAGGFGLTGTDNVISCGSFTTDSSGNASVTLGYEPQWVIQKAINAAYGWWMNDNMRGMPVSGGTAQLNAEGAYAEALTSSLGIRPNATGFTVANGVNTKTFIYIAIRRGPMKVPTLGTSVYNAIARTGTGANANVTGVGFSPDLVLSFDRTNAYGSLYPWRNRLAGNRQMLNSTSTDAEVTEGSDVLTAFTMDGISVGADVTNNGNVNTSGVTYIQHFFKRAPSFFDEVCWTGLGSGTQTIPHNLGAVPELMLVKRRSTALDWYVYSSATGATNTLILNTTAASAASGNFGSTTPTSTNFYIGGGPGGTWVTYLFATCAGVSKVGSYTGTATTKQIDCGFTAGARYVLIKRTDSTGGWYVWDSTRGIVAGNDPYLFLNSFAAEVTNTDYIDTYSAGFEISSTAPAAINANGGTFIFLAIA